LFTGFIQMMVVYWFYTDDGCLLVLYRRWLFTGFPHDAEQLFTSWCEISKTITI